MRKAIMQELLAEYEAQRQRNQAEEMRRRAEAERACPEIGDALNARQGMIFAGLRGILGGESAAEDIPAKMDVLNRRLNSLLSQHGLATDYLDPASCTVSSVRTLAARMGSAAFFAPSTRRRARAARSSFATSPTWAKQRDAAPISAAAGR